MLRFDRPVNNAYQSMSRDCAKVLSRVGVKVRIKRPDDLGWTRIDVDLAAIRELEIHIYKTLNVFRDRISEVGESRSVWALSHQHAALMTGILECHRQ